MQLFKGNILIAEDDEDLRNALSEALSEEGYFVITAAHGLEAIGKLHMVDYDAILLDLYIERVDGASIVKIVRDLKIQKPIVVMSGQSEARREALKLDIEALLIKPFEMNALFSIMENCVKQSQSLGTLSSPYAR